jgi:hypothetical protein
MIKALGTAEGKANVLLGLTLEDLEPLKPGNGGHWLRIDLQDLGVPFNLTLVVGEDLQSLVHQFEMMKCPQTIN